MKLEVARIVHGSDEYRQAVALRLRVLREPLGLTFTAEQLAAEDGDYHLAAFHGGNLVGCLVLSPWQSALKMRQVAVEPSHQGRGVGAALVRASEALALEEGYDKMVLSARMTAVTFYVRLGYAIVGDTYTEVSLPHRWMEKELKLQ